MRSRWFSGIAPWIACAVGATTLGLAAPSSAEAPRIYKWVDANGIAHYTTDPDRIPRALRNRIESIDRSDPLPADPADPATPGAATEPAPGAAGSPGPAVGDETWATRDATPRPRRSRSGFDDDYDPTSPEAIEARAAEQEALDARIAELEAEIRKDEDVLKELITDPDLSADTPLFDRPEFLEVSQRLPQLQERLAALRDQRAKLDRP